MFLKCAKKSIKNIICNIVVKILMGISWFKKKKSIFNSFDVSKMMHSFKLLKGLQFYYGPLIPELVISFSSELPEVAATLFLILFEDFFILVVFLRKFIRMLNFFWLTSLNPFSFPLWPPRFYDLLLCSSALLPMWLLLFSWFGCWCSLKVRFGCWFTRFPWFLV